MTAPPPAAVPPVRSSPRPPRPEVHAAQPATPERGDADATASKVTPGEVSAAAHVAARVMGTAPDMATGVMGPPAEVTAATVTAPASSSAAPSKRRRGQEDRRERQRGREQYPNVHGIVALSHAKKH